MIGPVGGVRSHPMPTLADVKPIRVIKFPPPIKVTLSPAAQAYLEELKAPKPKKKATGIVTGRR